MFPFDVDIVDTRGNVVPNHELQFRRRDLASFVAYEDEAGTTPLDEPFVVDGRGHITMWVPEGKYEYKAHKDTPWRPWDTATTGTASSSFIFTQPTPEDVWIVSHNLGYYPVTDLVDDGDEEMLGEVTHLSVNQLRVDLLIPTAGKAILR